MLQTIRERSQATVTVRTSMEALTRPWRLAECTHSDARTIPASKKSFRVSWFDVIQWNVYVKFIVHHNHSSPEQASIWEPETSRLKSLCLDYCSHITSFLYARPGSKWQHASIITSIMARISVMVFAGQVQGWVVVRNRSQLGVQAACCSIASGCYDSPNTTGWWSKLSKQSRHPPDHQRCFHTNSTNNDTSITSDMQFACLSMLEQ